MRIPHKILIFGATSAIAIETARKFASDGVSFYLCARNKDELQRIANDLSVRGATEVAYSTFDALDNNSVVDAIDKCLKKYPDLDGLLIAHGILPDQQRCETNLVEMQNAFQVNMVSAIVILNVLANHFSNQRRGTIIVISSVAGDRGKQSNYVYGAAKSALSVFMSGLSQKLHMSGVHVLTIKPGFVDTPMTSHMQKGVLFVEPERIALGIYNAILRGRSSAYLPWFWKPVMFIIRLIPDSIFNRLKL